MLCSTHVCSDRATLQSKKCAAISGTLVRWTVEGAVAPQQAAPRCTGSAHDAPCIACGSEVRVAAMTGIVDVAASEGTPGHNQLLVAGFKVSAFKPTNRRTTAGFLATLATSHSGYCMGYNSRAIQQSQKLPCCEMGRRLTPAYASLRQLTSSVVQANRFLLWDVEAEVEELSTPAGGWRRPFTVRLGPGAAFTVVLLKERQLKVLSRLASSASAAPTAEQSGSSMCVHTHLRANRLPAGINENETLPMLRAHTWQPTQLRTQCMHAHWF